MYRVSRDYLCTGENVPQALRGLQSQMIVKMATVFGLPVSSGGAPVSTETLCVQVDNAIKKAILMDKLEGVAATCEGDMPPPFNPLAGHCAASR